MEWLLSILFRVPIYYFSIHVSFFSSNSTIWYSIWRDENNPVWLMETVGFTRFYDQVQLDHNWTIKKHKCIRLATLITLKDSARQRRYMFLSRFNRCSNHQNVSLLKIKNYGFFYNFPQYHTCRKKNVFSIRFFFRYVFFPKKLVFSLFIRFFGLFEGWGMPKKVSKQV